MKVKEFFKDLFHTLTKTKTRIALCAIFSPFLLAGFLISLPFIIVYGVIFSPCIACFGCAVRYANKYDDNKNESLVDLQSNEHISFDLMSAATEKVNIDDDKMNSMKNLIAKLTDVDAHLTKAEKKQIRHDIKDELKKELPKEEYKALKSSIKHDMKSMLKETLKDNHLFKSHKHKQSSSCSLHFSPSKGM